MATDIAIDVYVQNVKPNNDGTYRGDFIYQQTSGSPSIIDKKGNIDLGQVTGQTDIEFTWVSPVVAIDDALYGASYYYGDQTGNNILISEGKDSNPRKKGSNPPLTGDHEFTVQSATSPTCFKLIDQNSDGKDYAYCMVAFVNINGGAALIDDPKILNRPG